MVKGGKRTGAGRPAGTGKFGTPTKAIRIPLSEVDNVMRCIENKFYQLPFYQDLISAGFPSPAQNDLEDTIDLNEMLIKHPSATFFLRVSGSSMIKAGINNNDILIVDRSLEPSHGKIVIASINGELTVKRLYKVGSKVKLVAENDAYAPIDITEEMDMRIWGVVTNVIHQV
jgi:DNA polymerase V